MQARTLREEQVEAERVIVALDSAIAADGHLLGDDERNAVMAARERLLSAGASDDPDTIKRAIKELEAACEDFVARRMNTSIRKAMQGHSIDEYETEDD